MNTIVDKIKAISLNERAVSDWVDLTSSYTYDKDQSPFGILPTYKKYDISVKLGASVLVSEHQEGFLPQMVDQVKRRLRDELYGDFRKPLLELEIAICQGKHKESIERIRTINLSMFGW